MTTKAKAEEAEADYMSIERWIAEDDPNDTTGGIKVLGWAADEAESAPASGEVLVRLAEYEALERDFSTAMKVDTLDGALFAIQRHVLKVSKTGTATVESRREGARGYSYKFQEFDKILEEVTPLLTRYGLLWKTKTGQDEQGRPVILWSMTHIKSGQKEEGIQPLMLAAQSGNPQDLGKALTYGRRYALVTYLNIASTESDADGTVARSQGGGSQTGVRRITKSRAEEIYERTKRAGVTDKLQLAATHINGGEDVGACGTKAGAVKALQKLNAQQGEQLDSWLARKEQEALGMGEQS